MPNHFITPISGHILSVAAFDLSKMKPTSEQSAFIPTREDTLLGEANDIVVHIYEAFDYIYAYTRQPSSDWLAVRPYYYSEEPQVLVAMVDIWPLEASFSLTLDHPDILSVPSHEIYSSIMRDFGNPDFDSVITDIRIKQEAESKQRAYDHARKVAQIEADRDLRKRQEAIDKATALRDQMPKTYGQEDRDYLMKQVLFAKDRTGEEADAGTLLKLSRKFRKGESK